MKKLNFNRLLKYTLLLIVTSTLSFMLSCQLSNYLEDEETFLKSAQTSNNLVNTVNELLSIRDSIGRIAYYRKVSGDELKSAYERNDTCEIQELLGLTENDIKTLNSRLIVLGEKLLTLNPSIKENLNDLNSSHCSTCDVNTFFDNYDKYIELSMKKTSLRPPRLKSGDVEEDPADCEWVQYSACLYLCTLAGPVGYWFCAYLCYCAYCTGGFTYICI
jgi:hypothetical protein